MSERWRVEQVGRRWFLYGEARRYIAAFERESDARLAAAGPVMRESLEAISLLGGNLQDEHLTDRTGANDAAARGLMYCEARRLALAALAAAGGAE